MADPNKFRLAELPLGQGWLALASLPGRGGNYLGDFAKLLKWRPDLVLCMPEFSEMVSVGGAGFLEDLANSGVRWRALPIRDFGIPAHETKALWREASTSAHDLLSAGGRVLALCRGGCGRSGMAILRLMVEAGEPPEFALNRLRQVNLGAVETEDQENWATSVAKMR